MNGTALFLESRGRPVPAWVGRFWLCLLFALLGLVCTFVFGGTAVFTAGGWEAVWKYRAVFWSGWLLTIELSAVSLLVSIFLGSAAVLLRRSTILPLRSLAVLYVELIRGPPADADPFSTTPSRLPSDSRTAWSPEY